MNALQRFRRFCTAAAAGVQVEVVPAIRQMHAMLQRAVARSAPDGSLGPFMERAKVFLAGVAVTGAAMAVHPDVHWINVQAERPAQISVRLDDPDWEKKLQVAALIHSRCVQMHERVARAAGPAAGLRYEHALPYPAQFRDVPSSTLALASSVRVAQDVAAAHGLAEVGLGWADLHAAVQSQSSWEDCVPGVLDESRNLAGYRPATLARLGVRDPMDPYQVVGAVAQVMRQVALDARAEVAARGTPADQQAGLYRALVQLGAANWEEYGPDVLRQHPQEERSQVLRVGRYQGDIEDQLAFEQRREDVLVQGAVEAFRERR